MVWSNDMAAGDVQMGWWGAQEGGGFEKRKGSLRNGTMREGKKAKMKIERKMRVVERVGWKGMRLGKEKLVIEDGNCAGTDPSSWMTTSLLFETAVPDIIVLMATNSPC